MGNTSKRCPAEVRDRAVRLFQEHVHEYPTRWEAMRSIAEKIGCTSETLRSWVLKAEATADPRRNTAVADRERVKQLERDGAELEESFPFSCDIEVPLVDPWDLGLAETRYGVDVSSWRDAMKPDDVDLMPDDDEDY